MTEELEACDLDLTGLLRSGCAGDHPIDVREQQAVPTRFDYRRATINNTA